MHSRCSWGLAAVAATAAAAISACALDPASPEPASSDPTVGSVTQAFTGGPCPEFGCGTNSPVVDTQFDFHDLSLLGPPKPAYTIPNSAGLAIVADPRTGRAQIVQGRQSYDLGVVDGRFVGTSGANPPLQGQALVGATITLTMNTKDGPVPRYVIIISTVREMPFFL